MTDAPTIKIGQLYGCPKGEGIEVPIAFFEAHREQAKRNHSQSLERLAERGGLGWGEAIAIIRGNDNRYTDVAKNRQWLRAQIEQWKLSASGIETEGHDRAAGRGAEHESPTAAGGDAQGIAQNIGGPSQ